MIDNDCWSMFCRSLTGSFDGTLQVLACSPTRDISPMHTNPDAHYMPEGSNVSNFIAVEALFLYNK